MGSGLRNLDDLRIICSPDRHYYKEYWGIAKPGPEVPCKWGAPAAAMKGGAYNRRR